MILYKKSIYALLCVGFLRGSQTFAQTYVERLDALLAPVNAVVENKGTDKGLFKSASREFCRSMTLGDPMIYTGLSFNAKNSLFMYRLCSDILPDEKITRGPGLSDTAETSYVFFQEMSDGTKVDTLKTRLPDPFYNTTKYTQELFDEIIQSYMSIYQASIYGKQGDITLTNDELIASFSKRYFTFGKKDVVSICAKDKDYKYPQTCKKMTSYLQDATNNLNSSKNIVNTSLLYTDKQTANCDQTNNAYNTIACGVYDGDMGKFVNLVYNELFFYTSFVQYYIYLLEKQPEFKTNAGDNAIEKAKDRNDEIAVIQQNLSDSRKAIKTSIRLLKELQMTFPMHIGLLMYTEAINTFVQGFNKTLIPIYTLGDIFRNVQDTK
ncbi:MAG: hypothetical protein WCO66_02750 [Candidatus Absconditabacteria bacterium]